MTSAERASIVLDAVIDQHGPEGFGNVDPALIYAQSVHETGDFTSNLAANYNNVYGMKYVSQPLANGWVLLGPEGKKEKFAKYATFADSVADYFRRQRVFSIPNTSDPLDYVAATVDSGYATDPLYASKWLKVYGVEAGSTSPVMAMAGLGLLLLFMR